MEAFGHGAESPVAHDKRAAMSFIGFKQLRLKTEFSSEFEGFRFFGDEGVGAAFEQKFVAVVSANRAAGSRGGFEQEDFERRVVIARVLCQLMRRRQPADTAADNDDTAARSSLLRGVHALLLLRNVPR